MDVVSNSSSLSSITHIQTEANITVCEWTIFKGCKDMSIVIYIYLVVQFINFFIGTPANMTVIFLLKKKSDFSTSDTFSLHLAILNTAFCLIPPLELANMYYNFTSARYVINYFYGMKDFSPLFLLCICLEGYLAVMHPLTFAALKVSHHRSIGAAVLWVITLTYAAAKSVGNIINFERAFTMLVLITIAVMVFCNVSIVWALSRSGPGRDNMHPVKKKACKLVLIILIIVIFDYLPLVILLPLNDYFSIGVFQCYIVYVSYGFLNFSSTIQAVVHIFKDQLTNLPLCC